ncbi:MAG: phage tail protein [Bacteroidota bacterium]
MATQWFAGNFCPRGASCSEAGALHPVQGPPIRSMEVDGTDVTFIGEIKRFDTPPAPSHLLWLRCDGTLFNDGSHLELFEVIGFMYGYEGRSFPALPKIFNENGALTFPYYICAHGGQMPERPA